MDAKIRAFATDEAPVQASIGLFRTTRIGLYFCFKKAQGCGDQQAKAPSILCR